MQTLFHDSHEYIDRYGDPDLGLHGILGGAVERLDPEMLLDPFEEKFDLPSAFVKLCDGKGGQREVVGKEDQAFVCFGVVELYPSDLVREITGGIESGEDAGLIADQAACTINLMGIQSPELGIALGPDDEESLSAVDIVEPFVIEITSVHDIERTGLRDQIVENIDIVDFAVGNESPSRDATSQIEQGMQLDCGLCLSERCPGKQFQTKINGSRVKSVYRFIEFQPKVIFSIKGSCMRDQYLGEISVDTPVPSLVCFCKGTSGNTAFNAHVVSFFGNSSQAGFDIPQTFPVSQLSKGHTKKLVPAGECSHSFITLVSLDTPTEFMHGEKIHNLRENQPAGIHMQPPESLSG